MDRELKSEESESDSFQTSNTTINLADIDNRPIVTQPGN